MGLFVNEQQIKRKSLDVEKKREATSGQTGFSRLENELKSTVDKTKINLRNGCRRITADL
jgi:hypothetical protein